MLSPNLFNTIFVFPILNLLLVFYKLFLLIKLPGAFGFSIIALTAFVRLLFYPFFKQQIHTSKKMQELKPHLDKLNEKHKKDPKKLQEEQMRLYKEAGINPAMGCIMALVNIPIFYALYSTLLQFLQHGNDSKVITAMNKALYFSFLHISSIDPSFFGFNLALSPQKSGLWYYYIIPVITGLLQYFSVPPTQPVTTPEVSKNAEKPKDTGADFQQAMNMQMKFLFPIMIGWFAYTLPVGLSLYWNVVSLFTIIQYKQLNSKS